MIKHLNMWREFSIPLLVGVAVAVIWANLSPNTYTNFNDTPQFGSLSFHFISNELFMVLFFGIAAVEITQSCLPGGDLNPASKAVNPLLATLGGVIGPTVTYLLLNTLVGHPEFLKGWGIPTATDIALAWLSARIILVPLIRSCPIYCSLLWQMMPSGLQSSLFFTPTPLFL